MARRQGPARTEFAQLRKREGISAPDAAERGRLNEKTLRRFEAGIGEPPYGMRQKLAAAYAVTMPKFNELMDRVGFSPADHTNDGHDVDRANRKEEAAKRRDAITGTLALAADLALGLPSWKSGSTGVEANPLGALATLELPERLYQVFRAERCPLTSEAEVNAIAIDCDEYFSTQDDKVGGGAACAVAQAMHHRVGEWMKRGPAPAIGRSLNVLHAELADTVGWLAFDAGKMGMALRYLQDATFRARIADCPPVEVRAMVTMCSVLNRQRQPAQALQVAQTALRIAGSAASPRLSAIMCQRVASAYAALGDHGSFIRWGDKARDRLACGAPAHDRRWLHFVTDAELTGLMGRGYATLGDNTKATEVFRLIVDDQDPNFPRNNTYYEVQLAQSVILDGDVASGATMLVPLIQKLPRLSSGRIARQVERLHEGLRLHGQSVPQVRHFLDAYHEVTHAHYDSSL